MHDMLKSPSCTNQAVYPSKIFKRESISSSIQYAPLPVYTKPDTS